MRTSGGHRTLDVLEVKPERSDGDGLSMSRGETLTLSIGGCWGFNWSTAGLLEDQEGDWWMPSKVTWILLMWEERVQSGGWNGGPSCRDHPKGEEQGKKMAWLQTCYTHHITGPLSLVRLDLSFFWHSTSDRAPSAWEQINRPITSVRVHLHQCANVEADLNTKLDVATHALHTPPPWPFMGWSMKHCKETSTHLQLRTWCTLVNTQHRLVSYNGSHNPSSRCLAQFIQPKIQKKCTFLSNCILWEATSCVAHVPPAKSKCTAALS